MCRVQRRKIEIVRVPPSASRIERGIGEIGRVVEVVRVITQIELPKRSVRNRSRAMWTDDDFPVWKAVDELAWEEEVSVVVSVAITQRRTMRRGAFDSKASRSEAAKFPCQVLPRIHSKHALQRDEIVVPADLVSVSWIPRNDSMRSRRCQYFAVWRTK